MNTSPFGTDYAPQADLMTTGSTSPLPVWSIIAIIVVAILVVLIVYQKFFK
jgi:hypothetical protein